MGRRESESDRAAEKKKIGVAIPQSKESTHEAEEVLFPAKNEGRGKLQAAFGGSVAPTEHGRETIVTGQKMVRKYGN